mgnify:CR=1 FL=1
MIFEEMDKGALSAAMKAAERVFNLTEDEVINYMLVEDFEDGLKQDAYEDFIIKSYNHAKGETI